MQMLYNSDSYVVVAIEVPTDDRPARGGYEIVDKLARKGIFIEGTMAETFQQGVQALVEKSSTREAFDEFISRFGALAQQPVVLH